MLIEMLGFVKGLPLLGVFLKELAFETGQIVHPIYLLLQYEMGRGIMGAN